MTGVAIIRPGAYACTVQVSHVLDGVHLIPVIEVGGAIECDPVLIVLDLITLMADVPNPAISIGVME